MKNRWLILSFLLGIVAGILAITLIPGQNLEVPFQQEAGKLNLKASPDRIKDENIQVNADAITIHLKDLQGKKISWSSYADTQSMMPTLDEGCNGLEFVPSSQEDIHEGDIIAFEKNDRLIVHRVQKIGMDSEGWFTITKGDSNDRDDGKIRWPQIKFVTFAIIC